MFSSKVQAIILAAGKSTRFNTGRTKLLEKICGQAIILYTTRLLEQLNVPITVVVGYQKDAIQKTITDRHHNTNSISFAIQEEQCGTGHALMCTKLNWERDHILILNGDVPLVTVDIIEGLFNTHISENADLSFVTAHNADPSCGSYGRIVEKDGFMRIIEARDFNGDANEHCCVNAGIYLIRKQFLQECIDRVTVHEGTKEFFITDLVKIASEQKKKIALFSAPFDRVRGINTLQELWFAEQIKRAELIKYWMERGVHFSVAHNVHLDLEVSIGSGTYIGCGAHILTGTVIGKNCKIHEFSSIENSHIGDECEIYPHTNIKDSHIGSGCHIGPFAHVKDHSRIGNSVILGNFVEVKTSIIGNGTRAKHLAYLGDARIGENVNIGAGTITCTSNSQGRYQTIIHDNASIGSNNTLVAPLVIEENAYTAAGSVISENVPANALAIARARQINKEGFAPYLPEFKAENNGPFIHPLKPSTPDKSELS